MYKIRDNSIAKVEPEVVVFQSRKKKEASKPQDRKRVKNKNLNLL